MKVIYLLKKGFQHYPPCLAQVLYLHDLGVELVIYHGKNSEYIEELLKQKGIENYTLKSDKESTSSFHSYLNFISYTLEAKRILSKISEDTVLWFGNCESAMTLGKRIYRYKFVLTVLELYEHDSLYDRLVGKMISYAEQVICCEKHRAVIMKDRYCLKDIPHVIPNKPYPIEIHIKNGFHEGWDMIRNKYTNSRFLIYQGLVQPDRPIDNIALALKKIGDENLILLVMGKSGKDYEKKIAGLYEKTMFLGYIPAPEHLDITKHAHIGIAIYDDSTLNNQFCAPNKIYEYAAFGIPMITSENLGLTETVGFYKAGRCVNFKSVDALEEAIRNILDKYDEYSRNAKKFYEAADCRRTMENIKELMNL
ncbi:MAG: glycosyltransferase family 4 protein [Lachnospiraceae bacterium]|nr:glycosyltransferase family 4 protein [Lachnospiraceae bacterium]